MPPVKKSAAATKKAPAPVKAAAAAKKAAPAAKKAAAPAKKAVPVKAAPQVTITLKQIAAQLAEGHDLAKKQTEALLGDLVTLTTQHLKKGDKIRLTGLGILQVRARRLGWVGTRRPANPSRSRPARRSRFRPAKELKEAV